MNNAHLINARTHVESAKNEVSPAHKRRRSRHCAPHASGCCTRRRWQAWNWSLDEQGGLRQDRSSPRENNLQRRKKNKTNKAAAPGASPLPRMLGVAPELKWNWENKKAAQMELENGKAEQIQQQQEKRSSVTGPNFSASWRDTAPLRNSRLGPKRFLPLRCVARA